MQINANQWVILNKNNRGQTTVSRSAHSIFPWLGTTSDSFLSKPWSVPYYFDLYGRNDSIVWAVGLGNAFSGLGSGAGIWAQTFASNRLPTNIGATYINPNLPLFQQKINLGVSNPYPEIIGTGVSATLGGIPSFIPLPETKSGGNK